MSVSDRTDPTPAIRPDGVEHFPADVEAREWLQREQNILAARLLRQTIWMHVVGVTAALATFLIFDQQWQFGTLLIMEVGAVLTTVLARQLLRSGRNLASTLVLLATFIVPALGASLMFEGLVAVFGFLSLAMAMLTAVLISPRAAYAMGVGLTVVSAGLTLLLDDATFRGNLILLPDFILGSVGLFSFAGMLYVGTSLLSFSRYSARRALGRMVDLAEQLRVANQQLEHEIRERQKLEEYRVNLAIQKERMDMLASFMRDVSHEFRTPLSVINGQVYMLVRREAVAAEHMHRLQLIREESDYIDALVGALFEMVRLDTGIELTLADLNLNDVVRDVVEESGPSLLVKDLSLRLELADTLPPVEADRLQIRKALEKLVRNAVYFSPVGQEIVIRSAVIGGNAVISVVDSGPGIPPDVLPNIFERFYRGDRARTTKGAGLGLPIACKIMQMHAGCIDVETSVDNGSTFHMYFPLDGQKSLADSPPCAQ